MMLQAMAEMRHAYNDARKAQNVERHTKDKLVNFLTQTNEHLHNQSQRETMEKEILLVIILCLSIALLYLLFTRYLGRGQV